MFPTFRFALFIVCTALPWTGLRGVESQLLVTATDDGLPNNTLTYVWTVKSAPAGATGTVAPQILATPSAAIPTATAQNPRVVLSFAGTYVFHVAVSDGAATTEGGAGQDVTITVSTPLPAITTATLPVAQVGIAYSQSLIAGNTPTSWSLSSGTLPAGLSLNVATGVIGGTPTAAGTTTFAVVATNAGGSSPAKSFTLVINPAIPVISATTPARRQPGPILPTDPGRNSGGDYLANFLRHSAPWIGIEWCFGFHHRNADGGGNIHLLRERRQCRR